VPLHSGGQSKPRLGGAFLLGLRDRGSRRPPGHRAAAAPPMPEPTRAIFLRVNAKWLQGGEIRTAGRHRLVELPTAVAEAALRHGHALADPGGEQARRLVAFAPPDFANHPPNACIDITQPPKAIPPSEVGLAPLRPVHCAIGEPRVGV
jgi:hypothetical protein